MSVNALPPSLNEGANRLLELAGLLQAGRPEKSMTERLRAPRSTQEVDAAVRDFAGFANDQYEDAVALLAALSTKLSEASAGYVKADGEAARAMDDLLTESKYRPGRGNP
jgi:hypothetical protein